MIYRKNMDKLSINSAKICKIVGERQKDSEHNRKREWAKEKKR